MKRREVLKALAALPLVRLLWPAPTPVPVEPGGGLTIGESTLAYRPEVKIDGYGTYYTDRSLCVGDVVESDGESKVKLAQSHGRAIGIVAESSVDGIVHIVSHGRIAVRAG